MSRIQPLEWIDSTFGSYYPIFYLFLHNIVKGMITPPITTSLWSQPVVRMVNSLVEIGVDWRWTFVSK